MQLKTSSDKQMRVVKLTTFTGGGGGVILISMGPSYSKQLQVHGVMLALELTTWFKHLFI